MSDPTLLGTHTSDATTRGVRVHVRSEYLPGQSSPRDSKFVFQYHVRISNEGADTVKLISRHWLVTNADGDVQSYQGPGVVGEQPVIPPGSAFEYTSFCPLSTSVGSMRGTYQMMASSGDAFDAVIATFTLATPNALN